MIPYVHMIAMPYSGSTLLGTLLDSHPETTTVGELITPVREGKVVREGGEYPCSCGAPMLACEHFAALVKRCGELGVELDLYDFDIRIGAAGRLTRMRRSYRKRAAYAMERCETIVRALLEVTGKRVFLDTSKDLAPVRHLLEHPGLDVKLLHLVRDPRAVLHSTRKRRPARAAAVARQWRRLNERALRVGEQVGTDRYRSLTYESLCDHPEETLRGLCAFLGVERVDLVTRADRVVHHIMGNRARLSPVRAIRQDTGWRDRLSAADRATCKRIGGTLAAGYGYV